jgi:ABC-type glycerol-3-phosphate transport system substrate-binding protein
MDLKWVFALGGLLMLAAAAHAAETPKWQAEWQATIEAAKKEGQVNIYIYRYEALLADFKREFPGINVVSVAGRGNELTTRLMTERRAGKYIADVYSGGTGGNYNVL